MVKHKIEWKRGSRTHLKSADQVGCVCGLEERRRDENQVAGCNCRSLDTHLKSLSASSSIGRDRERGRERGSWWDSFKVRGKLKVKVGHSPVNLPVWQAKGVRMRKRERVRSVSPNRNQNRARCEPALIWLRCYLLWIPVPVDWATQGHYSEDIQRTNRVSKLQNQNKLVSTNFGSNCLHSCAQVVSAL